MVKSIFFKKILFFPVLFLLSIAFTLLQREADLDIWHRMAVGKIFSLTGNVLYSDIFSYFPTKPLWIDHEWLSGVVFYNIGHFFGDNGILILKILIYFGILILIYKTHQLTEESKNKTAVGFYILILISLTPGIGSILRCQAFTYLFFTLWIYLLERIRRGENRLIWIFPATTLLWANMHGGFLAGFGLLAFYAAGEFLNKKNYLKYIGIIALSLPFVFINPYGIKYLTSLILSLSDKRTFIGEWGAFNFFGNVNEFIGFKIFVLIFLASIFYKIICKDKKTDRVEIITLFATLYISVEHTRHVVFFSIAAAVFCFKYYLILADMLINKINIFKNASQHLLSLVAFSKNAFVYFFILTFSVYIIITSPFVIELSSYPTSAVEFIRINKLKGNLLVPFNWGSYALWKLYPQNLVSGDGRFNEPYTYESYLDVYKITFFENDWEKALYKYHHDVILMYKNGKTEKSMLKSKQWKAVYKDKKAVVFVPASMPDKKWLKPNHNEDYYIKTKYENDINF